MADQITRSPSSRLVLAWATFSWLAGCLADHGRCSKNQELNAIGNCACKAGFVPDTDLICRPCGSREISRGVACECEPGFVRDAQGVCVVRPEEVGRSCASDAECGGSAPHCNLGADAGYCTVSGCTSSSECPSPFACDSSRTPSVCIRGPSGQGDSCQSSEDCAGKEASYCETLQGMICLVPDCGPGVSCFLGWRCCDLRGFGLPTLCLPENQCPVD